TLGKPFRASSTGTTPFAGTRHFDRHIIRARCSRSDFSCGSRKRVGVGARRKSGTEIGIDGNLMSPSLRIHLGSAPGSVGQPIKVVARPGIRGAGRPSKAQHRLYGKGKQENKAMLARPGHQTFWVGKA